MNISRSFPVLPLWAFLCLSCAFSSALFSATPFNWTILDRMANPTFPAWTLTESEDGYGQLSYVDNPFNSYSSALYVETTGQGISWGHTSAALPLKTPIADGETETIYFRYAEEDNNRDYYYGFSDFEITPDEAGGYTAPNQWEHFEGQIQLPPNTSTLKARDRGGFSYLTADGGISDVQIEANTWYDVWLVISNALGVNDDDYAVYIRGGDYQTITLLQVQTGSKTFDTALFRNGTTDSIKTIFIRTLSGPPDSPNASDDVYLAMVAQAPGINLSDPNIIIECFDFLCLDENGDVDTGNWMGWLNLKQQPWAYSYSFKSWIYF